MKKKLNKISKILILSALALVNTGCIIVDIHSAGVFKDPIKYDNRNGVYIEIPAGVYDHKGVKFFGAKDGSRIEFGYLGGGCGGGVGFAGPIIFPIIPFFHINSCKKDGFYIKEKYYLNTIGVMVQLKYNDKIYEPYIVKNGRPKDLGDVRFKIENLSEFKSAPDKTLIIHKLKPDGTIFTKELPFDWKIVVEVSGGL